MRAISLVQKIELEFAGNVVRNAITLGDVDNDGCIELVVGNSCGEVAIFKGKEKMQSIGQMSFVVCVAIGDVLNQKRNSLVIITADGWCYVYDTPAGKEGQTSEDGIDESDDQLLSTSLEGSKAKDTTEEKSELICVHTQRIPPNAKDIVLGDVDNDGNIEMVLGLTDRVVRSYRWVQSPQKSTSSIVDTKLLNEPDRSQGKFMALNKWECTNQIGSISLHHSWDGRPSLLIAQPGGTFMRIRCEIDEKSGVEQSQSTASSEQIGGSVDYQQLGINRMRSANISTEILGDFRCPKRENEEDLDDDEEKTDVSGPPYALATLDGTIMLVQNENIKWAIAVDHQVFALNKLDVTGNGFDDIVACSWDGQTYILDQDKNSVRFNLEEPVQAFVSGFYNIDQDEPACTCLVYVTFKHKIIIYYDIPLSELVCKKFEPDELVLSRLYEDENHSPLQALEVVKELDRKSKKELVEYLLYNVKS